MRMEWLLMLTFRITLKERKRVVMEYTRNTMKEKKDKFPALDYGEDMHATQVMDKVYEQPY